MGLGNSGRMAVKIRYRASDGYRSTRAFKTLAGARKYAATMIGDAPEIGGMYAVSSDGIGTIRAEGASMRELFPLSFDDDPCLPNLGSYAS